jgi:hypothetical protein
MNERNQALGADDEFRSILNGRAICFLFILLKVRWFQTAAG